MIGEPDNVDLDIDYLMGFHEEINCWLCFMECPLCFAIIPGESTPHNFPESDIRCSQYESDMLKYLLNGVNEFRPISFEIYATLMGQHLWTEKTNNNRLIYYHNCWW